jgi:hypothetical protein
MRLRTALALAVSIGALTTSAPGRAQSDADRATARTLGQEGQQALDSKDFKTAEDHFRRADNLVHAPTLMLGLARALAGEGKYVESQEAYNRIIREGIAPGAPEVFKRALDSAKKEVDEVSAKVGSVTITVRATGGGDIADAKVVLDEHPVSSASLGVQRAIDPGPHVLRVNADGYKPAELRFTATEGANINEPVALDKDLSVPATAAAVTPAPVGAETGPANGGIGAGEQPPTSGTRKILPWVAFGIGGAGLAVGAITGLMAMSKHSTLANACPNNACGPAQQNDLDSYHTLGTVSTIGFVVGGVGAAAGIVLFLTQPKAESAPAVQPVAATSFHVVPMLGPGSIGAVGRF